MVSEEKVIQTSVKIEINACRVNLDNRDIIERKEESYLKKKICKYCRRDNRCTRYHGVNNCPNIVSSLRMVNKEIKLYNLTPGT